MGNPTLASSAKNASRRIRSLLHRFKYRSPASCLNAAFMELEAEKLKENVPVQVAGSNDR